MRSCHSDLLVRVVEAGPRGHRQHGTRDEARVEGADAGDTAAVFLVRRIARGGTSVGTPVWSGAPSVEGGLRFPVPRPRLTRYRRRTPFMYERRVSLCRTELTVCAWLFSSKVGVSIRQEVRPGGSRRASVQPRDWWGEREEREIERERKRYEREERRGRGK